MAKDVRARSRKAAGARLTKTNFFTRRLERHFRVLDLWASKACRNFCPYIEFHPDTAHDKVVTISADLLVIFRDRYTLDGSEPGPQSPLYSVPFVIRNTLRYKPSLSGTGESWQSKTKKY